MIRRLRRQHRVTFLILAVLLPAVVVAAVLARPELPPEPEQLAWRDQRPGGRTTFEIAQESGWITLTRTSACGAPDLLLYWAPEPGRTGEAGLPEGARLLGTLPPQPDMRVRLSETGGHVILYSLGHRVVHATRALEAGR